jgi:hypothetical protein
VARFCGVEHAIPVGGGTSGLYLALRAIGVAGKRAVIPAFTCPAVAVAVLAAGGRPLLVDVSVDDCNLSVDAVSESLDRTVAAIIAVDTFGCGARLKELRQLASRHGCALVEDACQSYGGVVDDVPLGGQANIGVISFGAHKSVELHAGGFLLTDDRDLASTVRHYLRAPDFAAFERMRERAYRRVNLNLGHLRMLRLLCTHTGLLRYRFPEREAKWAGSTWERFLADLPEMKAHESPPRPRGARGLGSSLYVPLPRGRLVAVALQLHDSRRCSRQAVRFAGGSVWSALPAQLPIDGRVLPRHGKGRPPSWLTLDRRQHLQRAGSSFVGEHSRAAGQSVCAPSNHGRLSRAGPASVS